MTPEQEKRLEELRKIVHCDDGPNDIEAELLAMVDSLRKENADFDKCAGGYAETSNVLFDQVSKLTTERDSLRAQVEKLKKRLGAFLEIAERSKEASDRAWARARKMQDLATMARNGQQEEAKRQLAMIDRAPVVSDFGNIVERLEAEIKPARAILGTPSKTEET